MTKLFDFLVDPPPWFVFVAVAIIGFTLIWVAISFGVGHINQGI